MTTTGSGTAQHPLREIALPIAALFAGACYYVVFRDVSALRVSMLLDLSALRDVAVNGWRFAGYGSSPSFVHVFAFSLLTASCLPKTRMWLIAACGSWLAFSCVAELLQHPQFQLQLGPALVGGSFDPLDLCGNAAGALAAFVIASRAASTRGAAVPEVV